MVATLSLLAVLSPIFAATAQAQTAWTVTNFTDTSFATLETGGGFGPGVGTGNSGDLRYVLFGAMAAGGVNTITFPGCTVAAPCTIVLGNALPPIFEATANTGATAPASFSLTIDGGAEGAVVLDGNSLGTNTTAGALTTNRVFFVDNVAVTLKNLVIQNATAQGGAGAGGGGGGAGFGAGLFVNQAGASVTAQNVEFLNCAAVGGAGGLGYSGGGGGLAYSGAVGANGGLGGGGGGVSGPGTASATSSGGSAYASDSGGGSSGGGGGNGGGGGGSGGGNSGGGGFGGGGGGGYDGNGGFGYGGNGGFGGGGGGGGISDFGGLGGFGGGGGFGGLGGGGGGGGVGGIAGGNGAYAGAAGYAGGGGAAAGPAIFVVNGAVTLYNVTGSGFAATGGLPLNGNAQAGTADPTPVFNYGGTVNGSTSVGPIHNAFTLTTPVGQTSATQTATLTFTAAATTSTAFTINVLTQGAPNLDLQAASTQGSQLTDCVTGTAYASGATCTVQYVFKPLHPGIRYGAITLTDAAGNTYASSLITGVGTGPQATFQPGVKKMLANGFNSN